MATDSTASVVCNCGPLIALAGIRQLDLLPRLFSRILIPAEVHIELTGSVRFASARGLFAQPWLEVVFPVGAGGFLAGFAIGCGRGRCGNPGLAVAGCGSA